MQNVRASAAFTMIELIFVIVIIGILAAIAIPKLAATRTDAKATNEVQNLANHIEDIVTYYMASGIADENRSDTRLKCFEVHIEENVSSGERHISLNVDAGGPDNGEPYCTEAQRIAEEKRLIGDVGTVTFGGNLVSF